MRKKKTGGPQTFDSSIFNPNNTGVKDPIVRKNWQHFSSRFLLDYDDGNQQLSGTVSLRMRRDSIVWFSVQAALGIQIAKGIITRDSMHVLDLFHNDYYAYSIKELGTMLGVEVSLLQLQNVLIGNPVFDTSTYVKEIISGGWFRAEPPITNGNFISATNTIDSAVVLQKGSPRQMKVKYRGSKSAGGYNVSAFMDILGYSVAKTVRLNIEFITASDAVIPSYPFSVPPGYNRKR